MRGLWAIETSSKYLTHSPHLLYILDSYCVGFVRHVLASTTTYRFLSRVALSVCLITLLAYLTLCVCFYYCVCVCAYETLCKCVTYIMNYHSYPHSLPLIPFLHPPLLHTYIAFPLSSPIPSFTHSFPHPLSLTPFLFPSLTTLHHSFPPCHSLIFTPSFPHLLLSSPPFPSLHPVPCHFPCH